MTNEFGFTTTTVDILRHAECEGGHIFRGSTDVALSDAGWARLRRVTKPLSGWDAVYSSPMQRCRLFAEELTAARDISLTVDARFRELHFGIWEGEPVMKVWAEQQAAAIAWYTDPENHMPPEAESLEAVQTRVVAGWHELLACHRGGHVLLVAHGGVIQALLGHLLGIPRAAGNRFGMPYGCRAQVSVVHHGEHSMSHLTGYNLDQAE